MIKKSGKGRDIMRSRCWTRSRHCPRSAATPPSC